MASWVPTPCSNDLGADEGEWIAETLERWQVPAPPNGFRKLVAGRRLWNFDREQRHLWRAAL